MIEDVWQRIIANEGKTFFQMRGNEFQYIIKANSVHLNRTNRTISKKTFEDALEFVPLENTVPIQKLQAPSYIYGILMDHRIRKGLW